MNNTLKKVEKLIYDLCPLKRSLTGEDVEKSVEIIQKYAGVKFKQYKYKCGEKIND